MQSLWVRADQQINEQVERDAELCRQRHDDRTAVREPELDDEAAAVNTAVNTYHVLPTAQVATVKAAP